MCGIAGFSGNVDHIFLKEMIDIVTHRGPDDCGEWYDENSHIGLAHRRLSIIDISPLGRQPMWDCNKKVVIVFNGEIYNYRELKNDLLKRGYAFKSNTDTEVLLNLYLSKGYDFLHDLNGIFAFAIWDTEKKELFLARDGMGVKPLYYCEKGSSFAFGSELKSLLKLPIDKSVDYEAVFSYLTYLWCPAPKTMIKSVKKLEPGNALIVRHGAIIKKWQFYELPVTENYLNENTNDVIDNVRTLLSNAVKKQMVADVPVGAFLSGGLDSSAIVAYARQYTNEKLQCFTIDTGVKANKEGFNNDLPYAYKVADALNVKLNVISVGPEIVDDLSKMIYHLDEPQADPAPLNVYYIAKLARNNGIKVLLSGAGGDDLFTGYRRHIAINSEKYWNWIPGKPLTAFSQLLPNTNPILRRIKKNFEYANLKGDNRVVSYFHWANPLELKNVVSSDLMREASAFTFSKPLLEATKKIKNQISPLERMLFIEQKYFLTDHNLNYTDKMAMAAGVEVRVPFLDKYLIEYSWKIPINLKQKGFESKWILKKSMENILPREVIYRPKSGFGAPIRSWIHSELSDFINDIFGSSAMKNRGLFNIDGIKELKNKDRQGRVDASYTLLSIVCIELWCQIFLDNELIKNN